MINTPFIDLHPGKIRGSGPETALLACRQFLEKSLHRGHTQVRIITGLGLHGDGSPRLRSRIESEVLPGFHSRILSQSYEQGGAVIRLELAKSPDRVHPQYLKKSAREQQYRADI